MDLGLRGHAVLVTGGSRGIGREIALCFAAEGADVSICARDEEKLSATSGEIRELGVRAIAIAADLSSASGCARAVQETVRAFGRIDVLINNASTAVDSTPADLEEATDEQLLARINGKALTAIRCAREVLPHMRQAGGGRIIFIGGTSARATTRATKLQGQGSGFAAGLGNAAIANFSKHLSEEIVSAGILVNVVHPHMTRTDRYGGRVLARASALGVTAAEAEAQLAAHSPIGRVIEPDDIAPLVVFLASQRASAITGQAIAVDGGASLSVSY